MTNNDLAGTTIGIYSPEWCFHSIITSDPSDRDNIVSSKGLCLSTWDGIPKKYGSYLDNELKLAVITKKCTVI